jgi:hypothetical protein
LNKRTHLRPDTVITDPAEIEAFANEAIAALLEIFEVTDDVRSEIIRRIESHLRDEAIDTFINESIDSLDLIAGHYETGIVWADNMRVLSIDADSIRYEVTGDVDVTLHYGSGSDETSIEESFPFTCTTAASIEKPLQLRKDATEAEVDTSEWYGQSHRSKPQRGAPLPGKPRQGGPSLVISPRGEAQRGEPLRGGPPLGRPLWGGTVGDEIQQDEP